jgi:hypothetical protein
MVNFQTKIASEGIPTHSVQGWLEDWKSKDRCEFWKKTKGIERDTIRSFRNVVKPGQIIRAWIEDAIEGLVATNKLSLEVRSARKFELAKQLDCKVFGSPWDEKRNIGRCVKVIDLTLKCAFGTKYGTHLDIDRLDVPLDKYSLLPIADALRLKVPPSMGAIDSVEQYIKAQRLIKNVWPEYPPMAYDVACQNLGRFLVVAGTKKFNRIQQP